jgi:hypothetical protein
MEQIKFINLTSFRIGKFYRKNDMPPSPLFKLKIQNEIKPILTKQFLGEIQDKN